LDDDVCYDVVDYNGEIYVDYNDEAYNDVLDNACKNHYLNK